MRRSWIEKEVAKHPTPNPLYLQTMTAVKNTLDADEYQKLIKNAQNVLFNYPHLDPYDIVNDVVLLAIEKGEGLYLHELTKSVLYLARDSGYNKVGTGAYKNGVLQKTKVTKSEQTRVCAHCHQPVPISGFSLVRRRTKKGDAYDVVTEVLYNCIECQRIIVKKQREINKALGIKCKRIYKYAPMPKSVKNTLKKYREENKDTPEYKEKNNKRVKKWLSKEEKRKKWNEYMRKRYAQNGRKDRSITPIK